MPRFSSRRSVRHGAGDMFDLVADVEAYPQFLPMCQALRIRSRAETDGLPTLTCDMRVGFKNISESFVSRVTLNRPALRIDIAYVDGPFKYLSNRWTFADRPPPPHCEVLFDIDYEFKSRILGALMGSMFDAAFRSLSEAFERRANEVYGRRPSGAGYEKA